MGQNICMLLIFTLGVDSSGMLLIFTLGVDSSGMLLIFNSLILVSYDLFKTKYILLSISIVM